VITVEQHKQWEEWLDASPPYVAETARWYPPWGFYSGPASDQECIIEAYNEDGNLRVTITSGHNLGFQVFGVNSLNLRRMR
jgi:hypothetical protein